MRRGGGAGGRASPASGSGGAARRAAARLPGWPSQPPPAHLQVWLSRAWVDERLPGQREVGCTLGGTTSRPVLALLEGAAGSWQGRGRPSGPCKRAARLGEALKQARGRGKSGSRRGGVLLQDRWWAMLGAARSTYLGPPTDVARDDRLVPKSLTRRLQRLVNTPHSAASLHKAIHALGRGITSGESKAAKPGYLSHGAGCWMAGARRQIELQAARAAGRSWASPHRAAAAAGPPRAHPPGPACALKPRHCGCLAGSLTCSTAVRFHTSSRQM